MFKDDYQVPYSAEYAKAPLPLDEQITEAIKAFNNVAKMIEEQIIPTVQAFCEHLVPLVTKLTQCILNEYPNKRVVYLVKHGKPRTRKKNINRIFKCIRKGKI